MNMKRALIAWPGALLLCLLPCLAAAGSEHTEKVVAMVTRIDPPEESGGAVSLHLTINSPARYCGLRLSLVTGSPDRARARAEFPLGCLCVVELPGRIIRELDDQMDAVTSGEKILDAGGTPSRFYRVSTVRIADLPAKPVAFEVDGAHPGSTSGASGSRPHDGRNDLVRGLIASLPVRERVAADVALFTRSADGDAGRDDAAKRLEEAKAGFGRLKPLLRTGTSVFDYPGLLTLARIRHDVADGTYGMVLGVPPFWDSTHPGEGINANEFEVRFDREGVITALAPVIYKQ